MEEEGVTKRSQEKVKASSRDREAEEVITPGPNQICSPSVRIEHIQDKESKLVTLHPTGAGLTCTQLFLSGLAKA